MFGRGITLFRLFGFAVRVDASWLIVATLVAWSLATAVFPQSAPDLSTRTYWGMGIAGALLLFLSIVVHEFAHSLVARRFGIPMRGITLFIFGGIAEMDQEPPSARAEMYMALAGPFASVLISVFFFLLSLLGSALGWNPPLIGVIQYLAWINVVLVIFNLLPAFPLDGGRVLRSAIWMWTGKLRKATRIAAHTGSGFGLLLIVLGIVSVIFMKNLVGGLWWFLIGMFIRNAATMSYKQVVVREVLKGEPLSRFMNPNPVTVQRSLSIADLVENYIYRHHYKMFPVMDDDRLMGCVTTRQVRDVPRDQWDKQSVGTLAGACSDANYIGVDADAMDALTQMMKNNYSRLLVMDGERLAGVVSLKDLMSFLRLKIELEDDEETPRQINLG
ncbi:MAG TPA: site-2 protease family protein [Thermoanaerobaculia bacterium]|nr:site-2 protease family protein [Thermoanaerobaculia bacterium]